MTETHRFDFTVQEQTNRYELAQETIGFLMAARTEDIHAEEKKALPDHEKIARLNREFDQLHDELDALNPDDDVAVQRVMDVYCPLVKARYQHGTLQKS